MIDLIRRIVLILAILFTVTCIAKCNMSYSEARTNLEVLGTVKVTEQSPDVIMLTYTPYDGKIGHEEAGYLATLEGAFKIKVIKN